MSGRPDTYMQIYWGDYARDTGHLNNAGHGAYLMLLKHYWCTGAPLPDDDRQLARIACCDSLLDWRRLRPVIAAFFQIAEGVWRHKRVQIELERAEFAYEAKCQRTEAARLALAVKREKESATKTVTETATKAVTASQSEPEPESSLREELSPPRPPRGGERFAEFWEAYPHRGSHPDPEKPAKAAFLKALEDGADPDALIASAAAYAAAVRADGIAARWVSKAAKWLKDGCWEASKPQLAENAPAESQERIRWRTNLEWFRAGRTWFENSWGPAPGERDCRAPLDLLTADERAAVNGIRSAAPC